MDLSFKGLSSNPLMALINPASIPTVASNMVLNKNPGMFDNLFSGFGGSKSTAINYGPGSSQVATDNSYTKYYIIAGVILFIIVIVVMKGKK